MQENTLSLDIATISAVGMHLNLKKGENKAFYVSLYEIDRLLEERLEYTPPAFPGPGPRNRLLDLAVIDKLDSL